MSLHMVCATPKSVLGVHAGNQHRHSEISKFIQLSCSILFHVSIWARLVELIEMGGTKQSRLPAFCLQVAPQRLCAARDPRRLIRRARPTGTSCSAVRRGQQQLMPIRIPMATWEGDWLLLLCVWEMCFRGSGDSVGNSFQLRQPPGNGFQVIQCIQASNVLIIAYSQLANCPLVNRWPFSRWDVFLSGLVDPSSFVRKRTWDMSEPIRQVRPRCMHVRKTHRSKNGFWPGYTKTLPSLPRPLKERFDLLS